MMVLFLGGPWHNQRHEVTPIRMSATLLPLHFTVLVRADGDDRASLAPGATLASGPARRPRPVTYTRRYVRGGGDRFPVYVSADYRGPARA